MHRPARLALGAEVSVRSYVASAAAASNAAVRAHHGAKRRSRELPTSLWADACGGLPSLTCVLASE